MAKKKKRDLREKGSVSKFFSDYLGIIKKISVPTFKEWLSSYWKILLSLFAAGLALFGIEWVFLKTVLGFQGILPDTGNDILAGIYLFFLLLSALLSIIFALLQKGGGEGISSMFAGGVQSTAMGSVVATKRITHIFAGSTVAFLILAVFSPLFVGGIV